MPRRARITLPNIPHHIIQRGNNRQACFFVKEHIIKSNDLQHLCPE